jgi:outer membrane protein
MKTIGKLTIIAATAASLFTFTQCTNNAPTTATETEAVKSEATGIRVAYVNLDTLMNMYNLAQDINKEMMRKEENIKMTLTEKAKALQADQADFERKYKNNVYATPERAQSEYNRIVQMEQEIVQLEQSLTLEFEKEGLEKNKALRDSINKYMVEFNKDKGYDFIITKLGENLLYANPAYDITKEVTNGLNARYATKK